MKAEPGFERLRDQIRLIAAALEEKKNIPLVGDQLELILAVLERLRRRFRDLVQFVEKKTRRTLYTDFEDELGQASEVSLSGTSVGTNFEKFRAKARSFLLAHQDDQAVRKLRMNEPLTPSDLEGLERVLLEAAPGFTAIDGPLAVPVPDAALGGRSSLRVGLFTPEGRLRLDGRDDGSRRHILGTLTFAFPTRGSAPTPRSI